eukprot:s5186_g3.t1
MVVTLLGMKFRIRKNLPGQSLGATSWYWNFCHSTWISRFALSNRALPRTIIPMLVMFFIVEMLGIGMNDVFPKKFAGTFKISHSQLGDVGSEISFLKRTIKRLNAGMALISGPSAAKEIELFEKLFGRARMQTIRCDQPIQVSEPLGPQKYTPTEL